MTRKIVVIRNYSFTYEGSQKPAIQDVNLEIEEGEIVIIAGASGSGKSTLLRSLNGLIPHVYKGEYRGEVWVDGMLVKETPTYILATKVGFVFQNPENQIFMFTVERDIAFGLENLGFPRDEMKRRVEWALNLLGLKELRKRAPHELSDGQKQRVAIAGAIVLKPKLLVLDEPTSLLDPETAYDVVSLVKELNRSLGLTVILVEHRLELVSSIANRLIVINEGRIVGNGKPEQVLTDVNLQKVGLTPPPIVDLQIELRKRGITIDPIALDVDRFLRELDKVRK